MRGLGRNLHRIVTAAPPEPACGQECYAHRIEAWLDDGEGSQDPPEQRVVTPQLNANQEKSHHTKWAVVSATPRRTPLFLDAMNM